MWLRHELKSQVWKCFDYFLITLSVVDLNDNPSCVRRRQALEGLCPCCALDTGQG
jgi:hypothetical protein